MMRFVKGVLSSLWKIFIFLPQWIYNWLRTDSAKESKGTKLFYVFIDKLVIALVIAGVYFYFQYRMAQQTRNFDDSRRESELSFTRAQYVKDLVPVVVDDGIDPIYRIHTLAALVDTESIDSSSAIGLAQEILESGALGSASLESDQLLVNGVLVNQVRMEFEQGAEAFRAVVMKTMPDGFSAMLRTYERALEDHNRAWSVEDMQLRSDLIKKSAITVEFWAHIFRDTVKFFPGERIRELSAATFLVEHPNLASKIIQEADPKEAKEWRSLGSPTFSLMAELVMTKSINSDLARSNLCKFLQQETTISDTIFLQGAILRQMMARQSYAYPDLAQSALEIVLSGLPEPMSSSVSARQYRFDAALQYLTYGNGPVGGEEIEKVVIHRIDEFAEWLELTPIEHLDPYREYSSESAMIAIVSNYYYYYRIKPSPAAGAALSRLFNVGDDKLARVGLAESVLAWRMYLFPFIENLNMELSHR